MLSQIIVALLATSTAVSAADTHNHCESPRLRRGWQKFTNAEKKAYLDAELCLMSKPQTQGLRGAKTLYDELQSLHIYQWEIAHEVGQFLPFHRLFMYAHEHQLRSECDYEGDLPYWDETLDSTVSNATILDSVYGFGGDGHGDTYCITDGPFANYTNALGPGFIIGDHCIQRQITNWGIHSSSQERVDECMAMTNFTAFWKCAESGPHGGGHIAIGAQMLNGISSPGDPLFYMHHTWLDRIWAKWQEAKPEVRLTEITGNNRRIQETPPAQNGTKTARHTKRSMLAMLDLPPPWAFPGGKIAPMAEAGGDWPSDLPHPQVYGDPADQVTLSHVIEMYGVIPNMTVGDVMNTRGKLCYQYD